MTTSEPSQEWIGNRAEPVGDPRGIAPVESSDESSLMLRDLKVPETGRWVHRLGGWTFLLLRDGAGSLDSAVLARPVKAGDVLVLAGATEATLHPTRPAAFFTYYSTVRPISTTGFSCCYFRIFPDRLNEILNLAERYLFKTVERDWGGVIYYPAGSRLARRFDKLAKRQEHTVNLSHRSHLLKLVSAWLTESTVSSNGVRVTKEAQQPMDTGTEARVAGLLQHMPHAQIQALSIDELARRCGCSRRHLNRVVNKHFGCSVAQLKLDVRLERAVELLRNSGSKIIDVAMECGFNHLGSFSAKFRAKYGTTPAHWRLLTADGRASLVVRGDFEQRQAS